MKPGDLHSVWGAPDNSRLTPKQQSFRLAVHIAAKINALCDMYPSKTKTDIVNDLLAAALDDLVDSLPFTRGREVDQGPEGRLYETYGPANEYRRLCNSHYQKIEKELGNSEPGKLFERMLYDSDDVG